MSERFFVEQPIQSSRVALGEDEARHLATVMRAKVGDEVTLFDGSGAEFACRIVGVGKRSAELEIVERLEISRELPFSLTLAVALPKGDRQKWLIEKLTELGVSHLMPLITAHGVAQPTDQALERLRRGVIEASKQCGRNRLLAISPPAAASDFFTAADPSALRLIADPTGQPLGDRLSRLAGNSPGIIAAIGPEGGFAPDELLAANRAGWQVVSLGPRILRIETAAIALAAVISARSAAAPETGSC